MLVSFFVNKVIGTILLQGMNIRYSGPFPATRLRKYVQFEKKKNGICIYSCFSFLCDWAKSKKCLLIFLF